MTQQEDDEPHKTELETLPRFHKKHVVALLAVYLKRVVALLAVCFMPGTIPVLIIGIIVVYVRKWRSQT